MDQKIFWILELANNHCGSVDRAKKIIDMHGAVCKTHNMQVGFKLQLRDLDTLIHPDYKDSNLKYIKRFRETKLNKTQFKEIVDYIRESGFYSVATPFDEASVELALDLNIDILKIASCSIDDWALLEKVSSVDRMIVISTGGASDDIVSSVAKFFGSKFRNFALMHCVAEYPTPIEHSNLDRIDNLRSLLAQNNVRIGISTHESPNNVSIVPYAIAKGCTIVEKHVDLNDGKANAYSCPPDYMNDLYYKVSIVNKMMRGKSDDETKALNALKRGVFASCDVGAGETFTKNNLFLAMPRQDNQLDASHFYELLDRKSTVEIKKNEPISESLMQTLRDEKEISRILMFTMNYLDKVEIPYTTEDTVELSTHYGLSKFREYGALIINRINREYCKKLIVMLPEQKHPTHHHVKKEEVFELLHGDCVIVLNGEKHELKRGVPVLIPRGTSHSFCSQCGCVIEEISTTHILGDSIYQDPKIFKLNLLDRKVITKFTRSSR